MRAASALAGGIHAEPALAERAVREALERAGLARAGRVLLFLTRDFARHAQAAVRAAAAAAGTMDVAGCTACGVLTEAGWIFDASGVAALVIDEPSTAASRGRHLAFAGHAALPPAWIGEPARVGLVAPEAATWAHGRVSADGCAETVLDGFASRIVHSTGLRPLGAPSPVTAAGGLEAVRIGSRTALADLCRSLPGDLRREPPLHRIVALREAAAPALAVLGTNADGGLTLSGEVIPGERITWALRQPLAAEQEMRETLAAAVDAGKRPDFALFFSCLGRGPLFYGDEDRDLAVFRALLPGVPCAGAYGSGQVVPGGGGNRLFQNSVVTLLCESAHVQPHP